MASHRAADREEEDGLGWDGLAPSRHEREQEVFYGRRRMEDAQHFKSLLALLRDNPWPSSDPRWQLIEAWAERRLRESPSTRGET